MPSLAHAFGRARASEQREFDSLNRHLMTSPRTRSKRGDVRAIVRIGQVWRHRRHGSSIRIKQIHRADRTVEAWFDRPDARRSQQVAFADLRREYELTSDSTATSAGDPTATSAGDPTATSAGDPTATSSGDQAA